MARSVSKISCLGDCRALAQWHKAVRILLAEGTFESRRRTPTSTSHVSPGRRPESSTSTPHSSYLPHCSSYSRLHFPIPQFPFNLSSCLDLFLGYLPDSRLPLFAIDLKFFDFVSFELQIPVACPRHDLINQSRVFNLWRAPGRAFTGSLFGFNKPLG
jgi:hypothetical protein